MGKVILLVLVIGLFLISGCSPKVYNVNKLPGFEEDFIEIIEDMKENNEKLAFFENEINIEKDHKKSFYFFVRNENKQIENFKVEFYCENATDNSANLGDIEFEYFDSTKNIEKDEVEVYLAYIKPELTAVSTNYTCRVNIDNGTYASKIFYVNVIGENPEWLGEPRCDPRSVSVLEPTDVYFEILVNKKRDDLASESPVQLFRKNENGDWIILAEMFDDGMLGGHGDKTKGDRVYARVIEFYEEEEGVSKEMPLKIVVTTSDNQQYAVEFDLFILSEEQWKRSLYETEEASNRAEKKIKEIMQSPPPDLKSVAQMLCDYLIQQTDIISDCEVSHFNIVWITCNTGIGIEIRLTNLDEGEPPG